MVKSLREDSSIFENNCEKRCLDALFLHIHGLVLCFKLELKSPTYKLLF